jgi:hypothetical protein
MATERTRGGSHDRDRRGPGPSGIVEHTRQLAEVAVALVAKSLPDAHVGHVGDAAGRIGARDPGPRGVEAGDAALACHWIDSTAHVAD